MKLPFLGVVLPCVQVCCSYGNSSISSVNLGSIVSASSGTKLLPLRMISFLFIDVTRMLGLI